MVEDNGVEDMVEDNPPFTEETKVSKIFTLQQLHKRCPNIIQNTTTISIRISKRNLLEPIEISILYIFFR